MSHQLVQKSSSFLPPVPKPTISSAPHFQPVQQKASPNPVVQKKSSTQQQVAGEKAMWDNMRSGLQVQAKCAKCGGEEANHSPTQIAATGFTGSPLALPHLDRIQRSFGQDSAKVESDRASTIQLAKSFTRPGKVELRYYGVDFGVGNHGFIIVSDPVAVDEQGKPIESARETIFRGGPSANGGVSGSSGSGSTGGTASDVSRTDSSNSSGTDQGFWGYLVTSYGQYDSSSVDWGRNISGTIKAATNLDFKACNRYRDSLVGTMRRIAAQKLRYFPLGPNSNSVAHQGIRDADLGNPSPPVWAPGWKMKI
ncbi:MAG: hypothetical protein WBG70_20830 [Spirulinaceae cyanobacterium]